MRRLLALAALSIALVGEARAEEGLGGPGAAPWEQEVDRATTEQDREIDTARMNKSMSSVVGRYQSRVSRDSSALNHYLLGRALYYNADPVGARAQMTAAVQIDPGFWPAHMRLAMLLNELKNTAQAERHLREVLARKPSYDPALKLSTQIALEAKDWQRGLRLLTQLVTRDPEDVDLRRSLALVYAQTKQWDAAVTQLRYLVARRPSDADLLLQLGIALAEKGDTAAAIVELRKYAAQRPADARGWARLYDLHLARKEWALAADALEKLLPHLEPDKRVEAGKMLSVLRSPNPEAAMGPKPPSWQDVFATAKDGKPEEREAALRMVLAGLDAEELKSVSGDLLARILPSSEPEWRCRAVLVKVMSRLGNLDVLPLLSVALHDEAKGVRMLAAEAIADVAHVAGVAYLLPRLVVDDPEEYESVRAALARLTQYDDRGPASPVLRPEEVDASREAWRRWRLSEGSRDLKLAAIRGFLTLREPVPERFLYEFALDPTFDVMREGYLALRKATGREPRPGDALETKLLPRFPRFSDAEVTRANMRTIQDRVRAWWTEWVAERRALVGAGGG